MSLKTGFRKFLEFLFITPATLSTGFLSFAGVLAISPSFVWCSIAFFLAAGYESQVNSEGISSALRRIFDPNRLRKARAAKFLNKLIVAKTHDDNLFLKDYKSQKEYIQGLEKYIDYLEQAKKARFVYFEGEQRDELQVRINNYKEKLKNAKKQFEKMQLFFLKMLDNPPRVLKRNTIESATRDLLEEKAEDLKTVIKHRSWLIRGSWLLAIGVGVSSGFATVSAMAAAKAQAITINIGLISLAGLSSITVPWLVAISTLAAMGYTLLIYQGVADLIQDFNTRLRVQFQKRPEESDFKHILRCTGSVLSLLLGIFTTLTLAGSWWKSVVDGAVLAGISEKVASWIRSITIAMLLIPDFLFGAQNSIESVDKMSRSDYPGLWSYFKNNLSDAYQNENTIRFLNPFRFFERVISYSAQTILLIGHCFSMGAIADEISGDVPLLSKLSPLSISILTGFGELSMDFNYMPDEETGGHRKSSLMLTILLTPIAVAMGILKFFAGMWDYTFSTPRDLHESMKKMYVTPLPRNAPTVPSPAKPELSLEWRKQTVIETCDNTIKRLMGSAPEKITALKRIKKKIIQTPKKLAEGSLDKYTSVLAENRNSFWKVEKPRSQRHIEKVLRESRIIQRKTRV